MIVKIFADDTNIFASIFLKCRRVAQLKIYPKLKSGVT